MTNREKFEDLLRSDEGLQAKLRAATEAFEGDTADERAVFDALIAPLAAEAGLPFTFEEATEPATTGRELSDAELDAVAGGYNACVVIGGGEELEDPGACIDKFFGAGACKYIGVGFIHWD